MYKIFKYFPVGHRDILDYAEPLVKQESDPDRETGYSGHPVGFFPVFIPFFRFFIDTPEKSRFNGSMQTVSADGRSIGIQNFLLLGLISIIIILIAEPQGENA